MLLRTVGYDARRVAQTTHTGGGQGEEACGITQRRGEHEANMMLRYIR